MKYLELVLFKFSLPPLAVYGRFINISNSSKDLVRYFIILGVLSQNQMVGYFLPCKIVIYDDEGKTKIGMPKPTELIQSLNDEKLKELARDIEKR